MFDPSGRLVYYWSFIVSLAFLYNFWVGNINQSKSVEIKHCAFQVIIYRTAFDEIQRSTVLIWFSLDYFADFVYIMDILIHFRTGLIMFSLKWMILNQPKLKLFQDIWRMEFFRQTLWSCASTTWTPPHSTLICSVYCPSTFSISPWTSSRCCECADLSRYIGSGSSWTGRRGTRTILISSVSAASSTISWWHFTGTPAYSTLFTKELDLVPPTTHSLVRNILI